MDKVFKVNGQPVALRELAKAWLEKQANEEKRKAQQARAKKYSIAPKDGGALTYPVGFPTSENEYGDPVNYAYPADAGHARAALGYFNHSGQREAGGYTSAEWAIIGNRLAGLISRHLKANYEYREGRLQQKEQMSKEIAIIAKDIKKQVAYGIILRPNIADADGDLYDEDEVEKAAWDYMTRTGGAADWQHQQDLNKEQACLVESFIAGADISEWYGKKCNIRKGDWVGGMAIPDKEMWQKVEAGEIKAFSIKGFGRRQPVT